MSCFGNRTAPVSSPKNPKVLRELSHVERIQSAAHLLDLYRACVISCRYAIPDTLRTLELINSSLEDIVENAFALAILKHPLFTVGRINDDSKKPSWVRLDQINLHNHVEWRTVTESENYEDVLREVLEWQLNHRFTHLESRPQWRTVILRPADLSFVEVVFAWDHTAGDGKSGKIFHETLLACLNSGASCENTRPLKDRSFDIPDTAATPSVDHLLKFPISWGILLSEGSNAFKPAFLATDSPTAATWAPVRINPCTTRLTLITIEEGALQAVLASCRQHKTTLTGLIHALALVSMASRLPAGQARAFQTGTPVCLRRFVPLSPPGYPDLDMHHTVANCALYWEYQFGQDIVSKVRQQVSKARSRRGTDADLEATVWSVATEVRHELSKKLASGTQRDSMALLRFVGDWRSFHKNRVKKPRANAWEVSNLGVMNGELQGEEEKPSGGEKWTIERAIFTQSTAVAGAVICINPLAVKGKLFTMTCSWQTEAIDDGLVPGISSDLETWLNGLGRIGHVPFDFTM